MLTVTVAGGNLYAVAQKYLGDATQWNRIAQANGLLDPVITGVQTLKIPTYNPNLTGGVLAR
jgi:nucleoid-associated protein YgaU